MAKFVVLNSENIVENIIIASSLSVAEDVTKATCVLINSEDNVQIGYTYNAGSFIAPVE